MNAQGIAVFYGAGDVETALAEVRPPVGSRVVTAEFEIIRANQAPRYFDATGCSD